MQRLTEKSDPYVTNTLLAHKLGQLRIPPGTRGRRWVRRDVPLKNSQPHDGLPDLDVLMKTRILNLTLSAAEYQIHAHPRGVESLGYVSDGHVQHLPRLSFLSFPPPPSSPSSPSLGPRPAPSIFAIPAAQRHRCRTLCVHSSLVVLDSLRPRPPAAQNALSTHGPPQPRSRGSQVEAALCTGSSEEHNTTIVIDASVLVHTLGSLWRWSYKVWCYGHRGWRAGVMDGEGLGETSYVMAVGIS
ncbi:hypothetical protein F5887DRAFT_1068253 [Amanita rubescens]|nr:hypothetical protein F5887DRAFT_1068253 [Amanita rubescens]